MMWEGTTGTLLIGAKHHEAKVDVCNIPYRGASTVSSSLALWWFFFTGKLQAVDRDVLVSHAMDKVWMTYKECLTELASWLVSATKADRAAFMSDIVVAVAPWGEAPIRALSFHALTRILA